MATKCFRYADFAYNLSYRLNERVILGSNVLNNSTYHMRNLGLIFTSITFLLLSGCAALRESARSVDLTKVQIGMSKNEVAQALLKKPDNVVGAKEYDDGIMEVLQYSGYTKLTSANPSELEIYWLYFFNDRLVEWSTPPPDWEVYVKQVYEKRRHSQR